LSEIIESEKLWNRNEVEVCTFDTCDDSEKFFWKEHYDEFGRKIFENDVVKWR
jgi:hypothetical protein